VFDHDGTSVQRMHNGLLIEEGAYYGDFITPIIKRLRGHHEPQEEVVVHAIIERLRAEQNQDVEHTPVVIEFGSHWSYYSMWFTSAIASSRAVAMEPDPAYLEIGQRHAALNALSEQISFLHGGVGAEPETMMAFTAESDGLEYQVPSHDLRSLMRTAQLSHVDLVLSDIQGYESVLLDRARADFAAGAVRFLVVSTHHSSISGDPLTHQRALSLLTEAGAHVIAEHSVSESFSGDGLIAVSFDERDRDLRVDISHARARDSLFGELEGEVNHFIHQAEQANAVAAAAQARADALGRDLQAMRDRLAAAETTPSWRSRARAVVSRLRLRHRPGAHDR
jgi:FkbM family methyltransferase